MLIEKALRRCILVLVSLNLAVACSRPPQPLTPEHLVKANVLMPLEAFMEANRQSLAEDVSRIDPNSSLVAVFIDRPTAFRYVDPEGRFELSFPAVGNPSKTTRFMLSRGTRVGADVLALKQVEFALSDGAPLSQRVTEAVALHAYLTSRDFAPTSYDGLELNAGGERVTTLAALKAHADNVEVPELGGVRLFSLQRDELLLEISLIRQAYTQDENDYSLYFFIAEKVPGGTY